MQASKIWKLEVCFPFLFLMSPHHRSNLTIQFKNLRTEEAIRNCSATRLKRMSSMHPRIHKNSFESGFFPVSHSQSTTNFTRALVKFVVDIHVTFISLSLSLSFFLLFCKLSDRNDEPLHALLYMF